MSGSCPPARIEVAREPLLLRTRSRQLNVGDRHQTERDRSWARPPARLPLLNGGVARRRRRRSTSMGRKKRLPSRQRPKDLTTNALIEVHLSLGVQPENGSVRGDYSDTLLGRRLIRDRPRPGWRPPISSPLLIFAYAPRRTPGLAGRFRTRSGSMTSLRQRCSRTCGFGICHRGRKRRTSTTWRGLRGTFVSRPSAWDLKIFGRTSCI